MGGQKVCLGDIYAPYPPPPGSATGDKPNATTFIKPQLEFLIIKLCNFESVGGAIAPPCPPVATPLFMSPGVYRPPQNFLCPTPDNSFLPVD